MSTTPPEGAAPHTGADARANADARAKVLGWARRSVDLIPTPWLVTGAGAVLLATTAAFGGLETVPPKPVPEVAVGETYAGSDLEITVRAVQLREERGLAGVFPDEEKGERVLVVELDVVNTFSAPRGSTQGAKNSPTVDGIRVEGLDRAPTITHAADGAAAPRLQPDVTTPLLAAWLIGPDDPPLGDEVRLSLPDSTHYVGRSVMSGDYWSDVRVGAWVSATVEEVRAE